MKPSLRIDEPPFWLSGSKNIADGKLAEMLIADRRAGLTPAAIVEQRFRALLDDSSLKVGMARLCLPRADERTPRTIEYAPLGDPGEGPSTKGTQKGDRP